MLYEQLEGDGFIPCFRGEGEHWSFVKLNNTGNAEEVKEKERISDYCTIGAYYFKSCHLFRELYNNYYSNEQNTKNREKYVAPLYNCLIQQGGIVKISVLPLKVVHVLGTPEELKEFIDTPI